MQIQDKKSPLGRASNRSREAKTAGALSSKHYGSKKVADAIQTGRNPPVRSVLASTIRTDRKVFSVTASARKQLAMKFESLGSHSWACVGGGEDVLHSFGANQGLVLKGDSCVLIDSGFHNRTALQILRKVRKHRPKRMMLVNTHYHSDHVLGNSVFAHNGTVVLSHEKCRRSMQIHSEGLVAKYRARSPELARLLDGVEVSYPSVSYRDGIQLFLDDDFQVEVFHPGVRAHTDGDSIVHVPDDRVVFAGDVLWVGYHPNLEDSIIQGQVRALKMILRLNPRKIVPGHGPVCGLSEVRRFIRYLEELDRNSRRAVRDRVTPETIVDSVIPSWSKGWRMKRLVTAYLEKLSGRRS